MFRADSIHTLGTNPIPGFSKAGQQCYDFAQYTLIRNEIQKLSRIGQSSDVDWPRISDNAIELLTYHTKDVQIATYLAYSLFHQYQFKGLAAGLAFLVDFVVNFWEDAYPQGRLQAKIESLNWCATQSLSHLSQMKLTLDDEEFQQQIIHTLKKLESELLARAVNIDLFANLREKIESANTFAPQVIEHKEQPFIELHESKQQKASNIHLEPALLILTQSARELMEKDSSNPYAYYLNRVAAWGGINAIPYNEEGLTFVKPPEYFNLERIKKVQSTGNLSDIVATAEDIIPQEPFWLDLNLISLNALNKLDKKFNQAYEAVKLELIHFINRIPGIEQLKFSNNTPFISENYVEQINQLMAKKIPLGMDSEKTLSVIEQKQLHEIKEVIAQLDKKKTPTHIHQLELLRKDAISDKVKLFAYMTVCESLLAANEYAILKPYTAFIVELIEQHQLVTWEPSLALDALILTYRCMKFLKNNSSAQELEHVFSLITKMDIKVAMELAHI
ncbi:MULTISPECIES: TssA family type VI secretion system protein [Legionella]|uniref:TssA family type VI secretion system protein n=1 Tax=Legionella TaxID=445 RepID=UPI000960EF55|nr:MULTISPECIES: TssA family type VI secretion system protein [Legionella]MBN9228890.1 type VI secretion system domain-containing protein [Legionella steelei]OJW06948.1 MAG: ImpA domain-containing protein [Legionella sp. 39-23]